MGGMMRTGNEEQHAITRTKAGEITMPNQSRVTLVQAPGVAATTAPYSHALMVDAGRLLFISGQGPVDAKGNVVGIGDPRAQVRQVFANLQALVEAAGGSLDDIVSLTAYLRDMSHRAIITEIRQELLRAPYPT